VVQLSDEQFETLVNIVDGHHLEMVSKVDDVEVKIDAVDAKVEEVKVDVKGIKDMLGDPDEAATIGA
jgi:hypothetical protein